MKRAVFAWGLLAAALGTTEARAEDYRYVWENATRNAIVISALDGKDTVGSMGFTRVFSMRDAPERLELMAPAMKKQREKREPKGPPSGIKWVSEITISPGMKWYMVPHPGPKRTGKDTAELEFCQVLNFNYFDSAIKPLTLRLEQTEETEYAQHAYFVPSGGDSKDLPSYADKVLELDRRSKQSPAVASFDLLMVPLKPK